VVCLLQDGVHLGRLEVVMKMKRVICCLIELEYVFSYGIGIGKSMLCRYLVSIRMYRGQCLIAIMLVWNLDHGPDIMLANKFV
jgi:hypothetical protein